MLTANKTKRPIYNITKGLDTMPDMIAKISSAVGDAGYNIYHLRNESKGDLAYTLMDIESEIGEDLIAELAKIEGVLKARQV